MKIKPTNQAGQRQTHIPSTIMLIMLSVIMLFPFFWLIRSAFMTQREIQTMPIKWLPSKFNFDNFIGALSAAPFIVYFRNSALLVMVNMIGSILSSSFVAFGFGRLKYKGQGILFALLISSMMIPATVLMIPQFVGWTVLGAYNTFIPLTLPAFFGSAFYVFLLRQFYMGIPRDYDEAAFVDGANYFTIYWRIIMPLSKPALCSVGVFTFMGTWNDFMGPLLYLERQSLRTVALGLQIFLGQYRVQLNYLMAASTLAVIPMIVLFFFAQRYFIEGITFSGLKG
ncbi:MAG: carbohydrate ABC transporter permease [Treponema sp.]|jgi:multiple sugar transport system permease protein|nr:carbohydrate ABC transporter permease [Treponema sp.]